MARKIFLITLYFLGVGISCAVSQSAQSFEVTVNDKLGINVNAIPDKVLGKEVVNKKVELSNVVQNISLADIEFNSADYRLESVRLDTARKVVAIMVVSLFQVWDGRVITEEKALPITNAIIQLPEFSSVAQATSDIRGDFKLKVPTGIRITSATQVAVNDITQPRESIKVLPSSKLIVIRVSKTKMSKEIAAFESRTIQLFTPEGEVIKNTRVTIGEEPYFTDTAGFTQVKFPTNQNPDITIYNHEVIEVLINDEPLITIVGKPIITELEGVNQGLLDSFAPKDTLVAQIDADVAQVVKELELQKDLMAARNEVLRKQIQSISTRLMAESNMSPEKRDYLQALLYSIQRRLYENEQIFNESQQENQLAISRMQEVLRGAESENQELQEQNLEQRKKNAKLLQENETFRTRLLIGTAIIVLLITLTLIFLFVSQRDRRQKAKIQQQANNLKKLNQRITRQNEAITDSLRYAQTIQFAVLPSLERMKQVFQDFFIIYNPKDIVSGDFYWFAEHENKKFIAIVDCTGHGVPGAFMSMIGSTLMTRIVKQMGVDQTNDILDLLNEEIIRLLRQEEKLNSDGMDICLCSLEEHYNRSIKVTFTGAKRPLFYIAQKEGELQMQRGDVKSVGGLRHRQKRFTKTEIVLHRGDCLFFSSDGLVDQQNNDREKFGTQRLIEFLEQNYQNPMEELGQLLEKKLKNHRKEVAQRDDITFLGIRI